MPSPSNPEAWPLSPTEAEPEPAPPPLAGPAPAPPVAAPPPLAAPPAPPPPPAPFRLAAPPPPPPLAAPPPLAGPTLEVPAVPRPVSVPPPFSAAPATKHTGRYLAIGLAVLVTLGGSAIAVWRLSGGTAAPVAQATAGSPGAVAASPGAGSAGASAPGVVSGTGVPQASRSGTGGSKTAIGGSDPSRVLVDADDFSAAAPDASKWGIYTSTASNGGIWSPSAVRTAGGELQIVGTGSNATGAGNVAGGLCWCGVNGDRVYGIWQVRARFDAGAGYGPIIGLWPKSGKGDTDGYISAVNIGAADRKSMVGRLIWSGGNDSVNVAGDFTQWHVFTIEWRATFVRLSIDGKVYYDSTKSAKQPLIPHAPLHLYMQVALGPSGGVPAPDASTPAHVVTHFDWVRVYK